MKMNDKSKTYFVNVDTKETTTDKETKNNWIKNGHDVEFYRWSNCFEEFMCSITQEGEKKRA
jgi:hypothetical protein